MASDEIPIVPDSTSFSYLNEGAANIVYKISDRDLTPASSVLDQYGDGTPPPSEVDPDTDRYQDKIEQLFDGKYRTLLWFSRVANKSLSFSLVGSPLTNLWNIC
jgi:hypothetical protein